MAFFVDLDFGVGDDGLGAGSGNYFVVVRFYHEIEVAFHFRDVDDVFVRVAIIIILIIPIRCVPLRISIMPYLK